MKLMLFAVLAHVLFAYSVVAQDPILVDVEEWRAEFNASAAEAFSAYNSCQIRISNDVGRPSPVMVTPGTTASIRASNSAGLLTFGRGQSVRLACPGGGNFLRVSGNPQEANAVCVQGTQFTVNGATHTFSHLTCQRWPEHVNFASGSCLGGRTLIKTGFRIQSGLVDLYDACHDTNLHHTFYTRFILGRDVAGFQSGVPRPDWEQGSFFRGIDITNQYRRVSQRNTLTTLLGSRALAERFIHLTNDYFLSKGHLVAKADFLHGAHQMATFWYTNAAPQWQTFNGGNWNTLENDVRLFAARINRDLECITGTFGRADLPHANGNPTQIFLTTSQRAPAPRMFWKILYDPITRNAIAFIGLNNPYQESNTIARDIRCRDISSTIPWLTWARTNIVRGYSYACEVNDFRANFPDIPSFPVTGILR